eukprot:227198-Rhodomonas_salina.2
MPGIDGCTVLVKRRRMPCDAMPDTDEEAYRGTRTCDHGSHSLCLSPAVNPPMGPGPVAFQVPTVPPYAPATPSPVLMFLCPYAPATPSRVLTVL